MRREYFTLDVTAAAPDGADEPGLPTLEVSFEGSASTLRDRLRDSGGDVLDASEVDVSFRLHDDPDETDGTGVLAITNRITGEFILEIDVEADRILRFNSTAESSGERAEDACKYQVVIATEEETIAIYEKRTLLVYGRDGELLRSHSLIPSGVEL